MKRSTCEGSDARASNHARKRVKERCGVSKKSANRMAELALERGVLREHTKGPLRKWLDNRYTSENGQIVAWGDKAYIFSDQKILITVLQIPSAITRNMKSMIVQPA